MMIIMRPRLPFRERMKYEKRRKEERLPRTAAATDQERKMMQTLPTRPLRVLTRKKVKKLRQNIFDRELKASRS